MDEVSIPQTSSHVLNKISRSGGPVTCVSIPPSGNCVLSARGPYLEKQLSKRQPQQLLVFPEGGTIHGIHYFTNHDTIWDSVVYGGRLLAFCSLLKDDGLKRLSLVENTKRQHHYLMAKDWVWAVECFQPTKHSKEVILAIGLARHEIEFWKIESNDTSIQATRHYQIKGDPSCLLMSMDMLTINDNLWVAAGTAFHEIRVWKTSIRNGKEEYIRPVSYCLKGHAGVVHSVKLSSDGLSLVSTSDDRSVRFWQFDTIKGEWNLNWVGWGHSARVWSVTFAPALDMVVSVAEDGTTRMWSCTSGKEMGFIQHSCSLWTVDTIDNLAAVGATDGTVNMYDLSSRMKGQRVVTYDSIPIPDDRPKIQDANRDNDKEEDSYDEKTTKQAKKKKKKKKPKAMVQIIVGIRWESVVGSDATLLVATRSGSLMRLFLNDKHWEILEPWWIPSLQEHYNILPLYGCCLALHSGLAAIGTNKGDVVLVKVGSNEGYDPIILSAKQLKAVQGLKWINSTTLVSFHVFSVALWSVKVSEDSGNVIHPKWIFQFEKKHKGVPLSCAYDEELGLVIIGDSRGNLTLFVLSKGEKDGTTNTCTIGPSSILQRTHQKEHVTDITLKDDQVLSVGNDGYLSISYIKSRNSLQRGWSIPASSMTGVSNIWKVSDSIWVTGFYGNTFRMIDIMTGHEFFRVDTGGRQRTHDCLIAFPSNGSATELSCYGMAVCVNQKDGSNTLLIQHLEDCDNPQDLSISLKQDLCMHSETIFSACFFSIGQSTFLLTGSEDCTSKIASCRAGALADSVPLTPQESCVRAVCSSQFDESAALLAVGGGKVVLQFFLVQSLCDNADLSRLSSKHLEITSLGQCQNKGGASIDHRINAVAAMPLNDESGSRKHLVVAGDSDGCCHIFVVEEDVSSRISPGLSVRTSPRPILCIDLLAVRDRMLAIIGTTGGNVLIFDLPGSTTALDAQWNDLKNQWVPLATYQAHQMGSNTIHGSLYNKKALNETTVRICSGGDDQALCVCDLSLTYGVDGRLVLSGDRQSHITRELSFSAIKGLVLFQCTEDTYLLSVGYSQKLALWKVESDGQPLLQDEISVDIGDVNCLAASPLKLGSDLMVAVGGMGVEHFVLQTKKLLLDKA